MQSDILNAKRARVLEAQEAVQHATVWANPMLDMSGGAKVDPHDLGPVFSLSLTQDFSLGKQRLRGDVARVEQQRLENEYAEAEVAIVADVVRLAYAYALAKRKVEFAHARRSRFSLLHSYLAGHTFTSPQQRATSFAVRDRLRNLEVDEQQLEGDLKSVRAELSLYNNEEKFDDHFEIGVQWLDGKQNFQEQEWLAKALTHNVALANQRIDIDRATREAYLIKRERWPNISLSGFYNQETLSTTERVFGLGIGLSLPLWNRNQAALRSADQKIVAEAYTLSIKERQIIVTVKKILAEYDAARMIVMHYPEAVIGKREAELKSIELEFRKNRVDFLLFLDLDVQFAETANRVIDAQQKLVEKITALYVLCRDKSLPAALSRY